MAIIITIPILQTKQLEQIAVKQPCEVTKLVNGRAEV